MGIAFAVLYSLAHELYQALRRRMFETFDGRT